MPALLSIRPTSPTRSTRPPAFSTFTASRATRTARTGLSRPVRRATLASVRPIRSGAPRPSRGVGARGDRNADAGKTKNPGIGRLAEQIACALARGVADVAKDEKIADRGAGEARHDPWARRSKVPAQSGRRCASPTLRRSALPCTLSASAGSTGTLRSADRSRKLCARSRSPAASAARISRSAAPCGKDIDPAPGR